MIPEALAHYNSKTAPELSHRHFQSRTISFSGQKRRRDNSEACLKELVVLQTQIYFILFHDYCIFENYF